VSADVKDLVKPGLALAPDDPPGSPTLSHLSRRGHRQRSCPLPTYPDDPTTRFLSRQACPSRRVVGNILDGLGSQYSGDQSTPFVNDATAPRRSGTVAIVTSNRPVLKRSACLRRRREAHIRLARVRLTFRRAHRYPLDNLVQKEYDMKHLKTVGLCLIAMFAISIVTTATASAAPVWEECRENAGSGTKWETNQCSKASSSGKWEWRELTTTEKATSVATFTLKDTKTLAGTAQITCSLTDEGTIGPGSHGTITKINIEAKNCKAEKVCENVEEVEAKNLPWHTEMYETEDTVRDKLSASSGQLGWKIKCKTALGSKTDECLTEEGKTYSTSMESAPGGLVDAFFEEESGKAKCSEGGKESGEISGIDTIKSAGGRAIKVRTLPLTYRVVGGTLPEKTEGKFKEIAAPGGELYIESTIIEGGEAKEVKINCEEGQIVTESSQIEGAGKSKEEVGFRGCILMGGLDAECLVGNFPLEKKGELVRLDGLPRIEFKPVGEAFGEIPILGGAECKVAGKKFKLMGAQVCALPGVGLQLLTHEVDCIINGSSVTLEKRAARLIGKEEVKMASGREWNVA
jgi:hypothetical protein